MTLHPHVAGLLVVLDPRWRRKIFVGGLILMIPVVGWPAVLGYRSRFVRHMFSDTPHPLPEWRGEFWSHVISGWKAMGVIFGHLAPLYVCLALTLAQRDWHPDAHWFWALAFFFVFPGFSPLSFPIACVALALEPRHLLSPGEALVFLAVFASIIYLIPAGFLAVSRTGKYRSGLAVWRTVPFVVRHARLYASAWWHSCLQSAFGHGCVPFTPWGVVWCFLSILAVFNEVLVRIGTAPGRGWLERALLDPRFSGRGHVGRFTLLDGAGERVTALDVGSFSVPLPRWCDR